MKEGKDHLLVQHLHIRIAENFLEQENEMGMFLLGEEDKYLPLCEGTEKDMFCRKGGEVPASVEAGEEVLASAEEEGAFPVQCGAAGLSSCVMKLSVSFPEKIFVLWECLSGAGRIFPARPVSLLVMMPLLLGGFIAISVKRKEPSLVGWKNFVLMY